MIEINDFILEEFYKLITPNKVEMFDRIAANRTKYLTVALENIYQEHNASAVLRSCDCFGLQQLHVIEHSNSFAIQRDIALGAGRWVDIFNYSISERTTDDCILNLQNQGYKIVATTPHTDSYTIHNLPLEEPIAFFFGTERQGLTEEVINRADYSVKIPMYGFTESFNISVSVAILLQTIRQRLEVSPIDWKLSINEQRNLKIDWCKKILNGGDALEQEFIKKYKKEF